MFGQILYPPQKVPVLQPPVDRCPQGFVLTKFGCVPEDQLVAPEFALKVPPKRPSLPVMISADMMVALKTPNCRVAGGAVDILRKNGVSTQAFESDGEFLVAVHKSQAGRAMEILEKFLPSLLRSISPEEEEQATRALPAVVSEEGFPIAGLLILGGLVGARLFIVKK